MSDSSLSQDDSNAYSLGVDLKAFVSNMQPVHPPSTAPEAELMAAFFEQGQEFCKGMAAAYRQYQKEMPKGERKASSRKRKLDSSSNRKRADSPVRKKRKKSHRDSDDEDSDDGSSKRKKGKKVKTLRKKDGKKGQKSNKKKTIVLSKSLKLSSKKSSKNKGAKGAKGTKGTKAAKSSSKKKRREVTSDSDDSTSSEESSKKKRKKLKRKTTKKKGAESKKGGTESAESEAPKFKIKRPLSAYTLFQKEGGAELAKGKDWSAKGSNGGPAGRMRMISEAWKKMDETEKGDYKQRAAEQKEEWTRITKEFKEHGDFDRIDDRWKAVVKGAKRKMSAKKVTVKSEAKKKGRKADSDSGFDSSLSDSEDDSPRISKGKSREY